MKNMIGRKVGMTQVFQEDGTVVPVTVVEAGPLVVVQKKTVETDGYNALQVGYQEVKEQRVNKPIKGHFAKASLGLKRYLQEFRVENVDEYEIGQEIKVDTFEIGEMIDVTGISKGKGTQGVIKRHGFATGDQTHGSHFHRNPGGLSAGTYPGRVFKGKKMGGRMGNKKITAQNLEIIRIDVEKNLILIKGAIPGPNKGLVTIKQTVKN